MDESWRHCFATWALLLCKPIAANEIDRKTPKLAGQKVSGIGRPAAPKDKMEGRPAAPSLSQSLSGFIVVPIIVDKDQDTARDGRNRLTTTATTTDNEGNSEFVHRSRQPTRPPEQQFSL